ncbi:hypothetical protein MKX08_007632 [Trichoderma sp. CBMAI-0020]|nr:hypothetical protein MKX08_007632 [Trichoderma sp. CBMAI-0020]
MASGSFPARLSRSETELRRNTFRDYASSKFDDRDDRRPLLPYLDVIQSEERRIKSRKSLIQHLSEKTEKEIYKGSLLDEQEAESSNGLENEIKDVDEKIREPRDGFRAGVMYFKKVKEGKWYGEQCKDVDPPSGEFPNQKINMDTILSDTAKNRKLFKRDGESIKYFHFPANHMKWIETALERYHQVNTESDYDNEQVLGNEKFTSPLLSRKYWRGQLHGAYIRHMRPQCALVLDDASNNAPSNLALFLPYLHWETNRRRSKMTQIIQEVAKGNRDSTASDIVNFVRQKATCLRPTFNREHISSKIGQYLYDIAQVWDAMDYEADERLLRQSYSEIKQRGGASVPQRNWVPPLHIRRTLHQSYFTPVENTVARDTDQIVYRQTRARIQKHQEREERDTITPKEGQLDGSRHGVRSSASDIAVESPFTSASDTHIKKDPVKLVGITRVVMVDQLWMWILGEVFFDRTQPTDDRPEVIDLFTQSIGLVAYHAASAHNVFWLNVRVRSLSIAQLNDRKADLFDHLNVNPEGILLKESQDIIEELKIMEGHYKHQLAVVDKLKSHLKNRLDKVSSPSGEPEAISVEKLDFEEAADLIEKIENRTAEINDLQSAAARLNDQLQALLSFKQQEASIVEARAALQQGEESVKQGRVIMAFSIVTIFFVPLGFFTGFFGMNNKNSTGNEWMTMGEQIIYMFVVSAVISTIVLVVAFCNMGIALPRLKIRRFKKRKEDRYEV